MEWRNSEGHMALMSDTVLRAWIAQEIAKIEADERHHYPPALVHVNAPLALIQVELEARKQALQDVLRRLGRA